MKKNQLMLVLLIAGVIGLVPSLQAEFDRSLEPVILNDAVFSEFIGKSIDGVRVYSYSADSKTWAPIPFQVDEFTADSNDPNAAKKVVWDGDGILTSQDEIVFMAKDAGDKVPDNAAWPSDVMSKQNSRYEVVVIDPLTQEEGYVYLFYSTSLPVSETSYVTYKDDYVRTDIYGIGHDTDDANGLPDSLAIAGNNIDFLDSWRVRAYISKIVVRADLGFGVMDFAAENIYFSEDMDETEIKLKYNVITVTAKAKAFHDKKSLKVKAGPVRILRQSTLGIRIWAEGISDDTTRIPILASYFRNTVQFKPSFSLNLGDDVKEIKADYIAFGFGLNANANFVKFYGDGLANSSGQQDSLIDKNPTGVPFSRDITENEWPGSVWLGYSGQLVSKVKNASFLQITDFYDQIITPGNPALTYFDYVNSSLNPNVYGLTELRINNWSKPPADEFVIDSKIRYYYFAEYHSRSDFQQIFDKYKNSANLSLEKQAYLDTIPPAQIADLAVTDRTENTMTISWTAPGDDGNTGGPAKTYYIRYSATEPVDPAGTFDWNWWSKIAVNVPNAPVPAEPGTVQSLTIEGLDEATTYYFRMNVVDHGGNAAPGLSNVASMWTTPVELASFIGRVTNDNVVMLEWSTASESNNLGFYVERRLEDADWQQVGFVKGFGTTTDEQRYSFNDVPGASGDWNYRLKQVDTDGAFEYSDPIAVSIATPQRFALAQNYPNPFNPETTIAFEVPESAAGQMVLTVYDMLGRKVRTLVDKQATAGFYTIKWDGYDDTGVQTSSGIYIYRLVAGDYTAAKKMIKLQ